MNVSTFTRLENPIILNQMVEEKEVYFPSSDENILPQGITHFLLTIQLVSILKSYFAKRQDVKVLGSMMFYHEEGNPK